MTKIQTINKQALEFNESIKPKLTEILQPVFNHFGFTHFAHTRFSDGDRYMSVCADTDMARGFFRNALDTHVFFEKFHLPKYSKLKVIWDLQPDNDLLKHLRSHGYYHGVTVFYRDETSVQGWNFAVDAGNVEINRLYTQGSDILEDCIAHVQNASRGLFADLPVDALAKFQDNRSLDIEAAFANPSEVEQRRQAFQGAINRKFLLQHNGREVSLTAVEFEVLKALAQGLTTKVIARHRGISPRTVESCVETIRHKLRVNSKIELVDVFHKSIYS